MSTSNFRFHITPFTFRDGLRGGYSEMDLGEARWRGGCSAAELIFQQNINISNDFVYYNYLQTSLQVTNIPINRAKAIVPGISVQ